MKEEYVTLADGNEIPVQEYIKRKIIYIQSISIQSKEIKKYIIGKTYNNIKLQHGGDRTNFEPIYISTREMMSKELRMSKSSVERAGTFANTVDRIKYKCGREYKRKILNHEIVLIWKDIETINDLKDDEIENYLRSISNRKNIKTKFGLTHHKPPKSIYNILYEYKKSGKLLPDEIEEWLTNEKR